MHWPHDTPRCPSRVRWPMWRHVCIGQGSGWPDSHQIRDNKTEVTVTSGWRGPGFYSGLLTVTHDKQGQRLVSPRIWHRMVKCFCFVFMLVSYRYIFPHLTAMYSCTFCWCCFLFCFCCWCCFVVVVVVVFRWWGAIGRRAVCIWRCDHSRFCVEVFMRRIN